MSARDLARRVRDLELRDIYKVPGDVKGDIDACLLTIGRVGVQRHLTSTRLIEQRQIGDALTKLTELLQYVERRGWKLGCSFASYR